MKMLIPIVLALGASTAANAQSGQQQVSEVKQASPPVAATQPTTQSGLRAVGVGALTTTFYAVSPVDTLASHLKDVDVYNLQNENVGEIEDLVIDNGKRIQAVVVSVGGFLGFNERYVAVKPGSLMLTPDGRGGLKAVVNTTREQLRGAPEFRFQGNMARRAVG